MRDLFKHALAGVPPARLSPRQVEDLEFYRQHPAASALWHEVGVGKTHPTIYRILELVRVPIERSMGSTNNGRTRALVIVKRSLFTQWVEKIASVVKGYAAEHPEWQDVTVGIVRGGLKPEKQWPSMRNVPDIVLTNYDYVQSLLKVEKGEMSGWLAELLPTLTVLVLDEAHKIKGFHGFRSNKAIRARLINHMAPFVPHRIAMSGSPVLNPNSSDVWGIYHFLDPSIFGPTRWKFVNEFFYDVSKDRKYEQLRMKPGMGPELSRRMYMIARRITKADCPEGEFPEQRRIRYDVELPPAVRRVYDELERTGLAVAEGQLVTRFMLLGRLMALQQIASGFIIENERPALLDTSHKDGQLLEIMEEIGHEPVVIWAHFRHEIEHLWRLLTTSKGLDANTYKAVIAYGGMPKREFDENVEMFKSGKTNILIGHPAAVGAGMDFQRAQHAIRYSRSYTLEDFEQSDGRVNRGHSKHSFTVHHEIVCADTRDVLIYEALLGKKDLSSTITLDDMLSVERNA